MEIRKGDTFRGYVAGAQRTIRVRSVVRGRKDYEGRRVLRCDVVLDAAGNVARTPIDVAESGLLLMQRVK